MRNKPVIILVGIIAMVAALACGSSGETVQLGTHSEELAQVLQADPRFATSYATSGVKNDDSGALVEYVVIVMPDSNCPTLTYEGCESMVLDAVRVILTAPSIDSFVGIEVTLGSFLPGRTDDGREIPGKPPLANRSLAEWRELVNEP